MPVRSFGAKDITRVLARSAAALEILVDFERLLDSLGVYAYPQWETAEILHGPVLRRHDVRISLLFPGTSPPPAESLARLVGAGMLVELEAATMEYHTDERRLGHVYATSSGLVSDSSFRRTLDEVPIPEPEPVVVVHVTVPRRLVDTSLRAVARRASRSLDASLVATEDVRDDSNGEGEEST